MRDNNMFKLDSRWRTAIDIHSNLATSGIYDMIGAVSTIRGINMEPARKLGDISARLAETSGIIKKLQDSNYKHIIELSSKMSESMKMDYAGGISKIRDIGAISSITEMSGALGVIRDSGILELSSSMKAWQSRMKHMSSDFVTNYNSIIANSIKDLTSEIRTINDNNLEFNFVEALKIDDLAAEFSYVGEPEVDYRIEHEIDLEEVKDIVYARIANVKLIAKNENKDVVFAIKELTESIKSSSSKDGLMNSVIAGVLTQIVVWFLIFIFGALSPSVPSNADIKHTVKATKQIVRIMEVDNNFYNTIRIVTKDGLEVRCSDKMKSRVKYYLNFGDLVQIEHKNRNWTKISYTNVYTDEREVGWVLTRYIKRLD